MHLTKRQTITLISGVLGALLLLILIWQYVPALRLLRWPEFDRAAFVRGMRAQGLVAAVPLVLLLMALSLIPGAPVSVIAVISGICLGAPLGFAVNVVGFTVGNMAGSQLVDRVADRRRSTRSPKQSRMLDDLLKMQHPRLGLVLAYAVPFIPNPLVHVAAAELRIPRQQMVGLILAGSLPTAFAYAFGGDAVLRFRPGRLTVAALIIIALAGLIWLIRRDRKQNRA